MSKTILVAEDEDEIRELIESSLRRSRFEVIVATDGPQALEALQETRPDLCLLDIQMPTMSGLAVLAEIRKRPDMRRTPVVMLTASGHEDNVRRAIELGASDYLVKPFPFEELGKRLAIHMFDPATLRNVLSKVNTSDASFVKAQGGLDSFFKTYPIRLGPRQFCVFLPKGTNVRDVMGLDEDSLMNSNASMPMVVFEKHLTGWTCIWPIEE